MTEPKNDMKLSTNIPNVYFSDLFVIDLRQ
jgi:hypothetical protein